MCDAAGQGRSHGYPPPKKNPVGGKAAIGLTRLPEVFRFRQLRLCRQLRRREFQAAANQCVWPVEPTQHSGQDNQLMRILPYGSAAVKVRVKTWAAKLGHFLRDGFGKRGWFRAFGVRPRAFGGETTETPGAKWWYC